MVEMHLNPPRALYTRPLQSFKAVEDLTTILHQEIQRQYQYCWVMYGDTVCVDQAMRLCIEEMNDLVGEYENKVPYHACGKIEIKLWAGTGDRVMQAALWNEIEKVGSQPSIPHAQYKRVVAQLHERIIWYEENSVQGVTSPGVRFSPMSPPRSLAEDLDVTHLDERDRELAESWHGGDKWTNGQEAEVDHIIASDETFGSSTEPFERNNDPTPSPEPVDQYDDGVEDGSGVLLPNDPTAERKYNRVTGGTSVDRGGYSGGDYDCIRSPQRCYCRPPSVVYL